MGKTSSAIGFNVDQKVVMGQSVWEQLFKGFLLFDKNVSHDDHDNELIQTCG